MVIYYSRVTLFFKHTTTGYMSSCYQLLSQLLLHEKIIFVQRYSHLTQLARSKLPIEFRERFRVSLCKQLLDYWWASRYCIIYYLLQLCVWSYIFYFITTFLMEIKCRKYPLSVRTVLVPMIYYYSNTSTYGIWEMLLWN